MKSGAERTNHRVGGVHTDEAVHDTHFYVQLALRDTLNRPRELVVVAVDQQERTTTCKRCYVCTL